MKTLVIGGRGFLGQAVMKAIGRGAVSFDTRPGGQNHVQGSILSQEDLKKAVEGSDAVVNLAGLSPLKKPNGPSYEQMHVDGARNVLVAFKGKRIVHISALGADPNGPTEYIRTKGRAEKLLEGKATILRPSIIYDKENEFVQMCKKNAWTRFFPGIRARVQPIFRDDLAKIIALAVKGKINGKVDIAGPDKMSMFDMARTIYAKIGYSCLPLPLWIVKLGIRLFGWSMGMGKDQIAAFELDSTTDNNAASEYITLTLYSNWVNKNI